MLRTIIFGILTFLYCSSVLAARIEVRPREEASAPLEAEIVEELAPWPEQKALHEDLPSICKYSFGAGCILSAVSAGLAHTACHTVLGAAVAGGSSCCCVCAFSCYTCWNLRRMKKTLLIPEGLAPERVTMQDETCPICQHPYSDRNSIHIQTPCHHSEHKECYEQLINQDDTEPLCPVCRAEIPTNGRVQVFKAVPPVVEEEVQQ